MLETEENNGTEEFGLATPTQTHLKIVNDCQSLSKYTMVSVIVIGLCVGGHVCWVVVVFWTILVFSIQVSKSVTFLVPRREYHYNGVIMTTVASQITSLTVVYSIVYAGADQRKHQSSVSLAFLRGIHRDRWIPRTKGH